MSIKFKLSINKFRI